MLVEAIDTATTAAIVAMFVLWIPIVIGVTIYEARRFYLLIQWKRGNATIDDLPPLREELPEVSLREGLRRLF